MNGQGYRGEVLLWNIVDHELMAPYQPSVLVPARLEFHTHENIYSLLSHPTDFSFLLRQSGDINTFISRIYYLSWIHRGCVASNGLLLDQNVAFDLRSRRSSLFVRVFASTPRLSVLPGAGSGACALRGTPATVFVTFCSPLQVTLRPRSIFQFRFPKI